MQKADAFALSLYDLEDAAYDASEIRDFSEANGHLAIIDSNPRRGDPKPDGRGERKVFLHLLFGLLVIAVEQASAAMLC